MYEAWFGLKVNGSIIKCILWGSPEGPSVEYFRERFKLSELKGVKSEVVRVRVEEIE